MSASTPIPPPGSSGRPRAGRFGLPLRWRVALPVLAGVVPLVTCVLAYQYAGYRADLGVAGQRTLAAARSMSLLIDERLQGRIATLQMLAISRSVETGDLAVFRNKLEAVVANQFPGGIIRLSTKDGHVVVNTLAPANATARRQDIESLRKVFATGEPAISDLYPSASGRRQYISIDVPVRDSAGRTAYVLSLRPDLDIFARLVRRQRLPTDWVVAVFDRRGATLAQVPNGDRFFANRVSPSLFGAPGAAPESILDVVSLEGITLLTGFSHGERFGWTVAVGAPRWALTGAAIVGALGTLGTGIAVLTVGLMLAIYAARGIGGPIASLRLLAATPGCETLPDVRPTGLAETDAVAEALLAADAERRSSSPSEAFLPDGIESIPAGFAVYDGEDRLVVCNDAYRRLFSGNPADVAIGARFEDMLRAAASGERPPPAAAGRESEWVAEHLLSHRDPNAAAQQQLPNGRWVLVRQRGLSNGGSAGLRIEITALKSAEAALRGSEERVLRIVDAVPSAIVMVAGDGMIGMVNAQAERAFGYSRDELLGRRIETLLPERHRAAHPGWRASFFAAPQARPMGVGRDLFALRKDGTEFPIEVGLSPIDTDGGRVVLASIVDISERQRTEAQLRQAQKMDAIGNLTGGLADDFNTLLGVVIGNLDLARDLTEETGDVRGLVDEALDAAWHGADLTRRLLAFARRQPLRPVPIDVNELIADTVRLLRRLLGEDVEVELQPGAGLWPVVADPAQLEAALANLAANARDAMPRGGRLIVATANRILDAHYAASHPDVTPGDFVMVEVGDTGTGMTPEVMSQIFEPFFTTKEAGHGAGLGLSMVFGFLHQSGGHVDVSSEPEAGTNFRLYLPRAAGEGGPCEAAARFAAARGGGETILVVEDNLRVRRVVLRQLREIGYRVLECDRATNALDILHGEPVDLLFTDIVMPGGLDGLELARIARERWPDLKVVLTSGLPRTRVEDEAELPGGVRLLGKPYRREALAAVLREALGG